MNQHLEQLKDLTARLAPSLGDISEPVGTVRVYLTEQGHMVGVGLYYGKDVAVARIMATAGTVLPCHRHATQYEWLGVITGSCTVVLLDDAGAETSRTDLKPGEAVRLAPGQAHKCIYQEDTVLWALSMPPAEGFPPPGCP